MGQNRNTLVFPTENELNRPPGRKTPILVNRGSGFGLHSHLFDLKKTWGFCMLLLNHKDLMWAPVSWTLRILPAILSVGLRRSRRVGWAAIHDDGIQRGT